MSLRRAALAMLCAAAPAVALAQEPPPALVEATEEASALCSDLGGTPKILDDYATSRDLNGDGRMDFVTDLARLECHGAWGAFCGTSGCPVSAWLSAPGDAWDRFDFGRLRGLVIREGDAGALPEVVASYDAAHCDDAHPDGCTRTWSFAANAPQEPPIDTPPQPEPATGAAGVEPVAPGWTLRRVPGASPVALGGGVGDIASLSAFCLQGRPFLAVSFLQRPAGDRAALGFAFSQGGVEASAGFEATADGAYVVDLGDGPLADRLGGRDSDVAVSVDGTPEGTLSLSGSSRAIQGALAACR